METISPPGVDRDADCSGETLGRPFLIMGGMRAGFSRQSAGEASPTARKSRSPKMADSWV